MRDEVLEEVGHGGHSANFGKQAVIPFSIGIPKREPSEERSSEFQKYSIHMLLKRLDMQC